MADKITQTSELKLEAKFYDGDTRTLTIENPKSTVDKAAVKAFEATAKETQAILGDKTGAAFVGISTAKTRSVKRTDVDLR